MQTNLRVIIMTPVLALLICLASCTFDSDTKLKAEVASLTMDKDVLSTKVDSLTLEKAEIQKKYDAFFADILSNRWRDQNNKIAAGIASGCDWLIPLCPSSLVANGRVAIEYGYTPDQILSILTFIVKFLVFGFIISVLHQILIFLDIKWKMPADLALIEAKEIIENAKHLMLHEKDQLQDLLNEKDQWEVRINELKKSAKEKEVIFDDVGCKIILRLNTCSILEKKIEKLKEMEDLLIVNLIL